MQKSTTHLLKALSFSALALSASSYAALIPSATYYGNVGMSTDGWGGTSNSGVISASVEAGSTVLAAYLYTATQGSTFTPSVALDGVNVTFGPEVTNPSLTHTGMHKADVTSIVKSTIEAGPGGVYNFSIEELVGGADVDGSGLVIVYENSSLPVASVGLLDGFSDILGDSTSINFANPLDPTQPGFFADMVLGIGFSCCNQASDVSVNGTLITENAGGFDDGENLANGSLITFGSFDDAYSPFMPTYDEDTERYDLTNYINVGDTSITIDTINPSVDDNIFFAGFYVSGEAGFNAPPPSINAPEPGTLAMMGCLLAGLAGFRQRTKQS